MLNFKEYQILDEDMQTQLLSLNGVYLDLFCMELNCRRELYALYNFYVEIIFDEQTDEPLYLNPFDNTLQLEKYLDQIDVAESLVTGEKGSR
ncbi:MAG: hypothetical protein V4676_07320 [Bacteroidota bacterium]